MALLKVLLGLNGANKVWHLPGQQTEPAGRSRQGVVVFFVGDQLEGGVSDEVLRAQDPRSQAAEMSSKWPGWDVMVVMPSRLEAGASCFDHFLNRTTRTGEPLGYQGKTMRATGQLWSLMGQAGFLGSSWQDQCGEAAETSVVDKPVPSLPEIVVVGFSKGGVVLNQLLSEMGHCCTAAEDGDNQLCTNQASFDWVHPGHQRRGHPNATYRKLSLFIGGMLRPLHMPRDVTGTSPGKEQAGLCGGRPTITFPKAPSRPLQVFKPFVKAIKEVHYCDAGLHSRGAFMTDPSVAEQLGSCREFVSGLHVVLHGTPRQLQDPSRPWLLDEASRCVDFLQRSGIDAKLERYFVGEEPSLEMHFKSITAMRVHGFCTGAAHHYASQAMVATSGEQLRN